MFVGIIISGCAFSRPTQRDVFFTISLFDAAYCFFFVVVIVVLFYYRLFGCCSVSNVNFYGTTQIAGDRNDDWRMPGCAFAEPLSFTYLSRC